MKRIVKQNTSQADIDEHWNRRFNVTSFLFDRQLSFVEDPAPFKIAVCSRRAGKTIACAADLIRTAINTPDVICLYITLSAANAKKLVWKELKKINEKYRLNGSVNEVEGSITFQNKSIIYISGAKDKSEIEKFRGLPVKLCYIDECQSFRAYIKDLIDDIIEPALLDHAGSLCLIGTPGPVLAGYFYECSQSETWSKHRWTFFDNFKLPALQQGHTHQSLLERTLKRRGITAKDPSIQREYFGIWEPDSESLLIKYDPRKNNFTDLPALPGNQPWNYIMGIDLGFKDSDAIAILAWHPLTPATYLVEECITPKQGIEELAVQIKSLDLKYKVDKMMMDMGALGKKIGEEIIRRHQIPVEAADKTRKMENVELLNDALRSKRFMARSTSRFAQDSYLVEKDLDKSTPEKTVVSAAYHSDIIDSVLYGFKVSPAYSYEVPIALPPKPGSPEWHKKQAEDRRRLDEQMFEKEMEGLKEEQTYQNFMNNDGYGDSSN